jgi:hypothetical protein
MMKWIICFIPVLLLAACYSPNSNQYCHLPKRIVRIDWDTVRKGPPPLEKSKEVKSEKIYTSYSEEVKNLQVPENTYRIDPQKENVVKVGKRGTTLHIAPNSLVDKNGQPYTGEVNLHYKEFSNSSEMAFSGINMWYKNSTDELRFNSAGMFEVKATTNNGEEIYVGKDKSIGVDFRLVKNNPGTDFYRLDEKNNKWTKVSGLTRQRDSLQTADVIPIYWYVDGRKLVKTDNNMQNLGQIYVDAGHSYPSIVQGLSINRFGIYNCDQVYRLANKIEVTAKYMDASTSKELKDLQVLSLIDLNFNGAFSFNPNQFTCDSKSRNVLLLFTTSGNLYYLSEEAFRSKNLESSGEVTFKMTNVSAKVKSTEDLQKLLGI